MVNNWLNIIQESILPPTCLLCGAPGLNSLDLCCSCRNTFPKNDNCCYQCAAILDTPSDLLVLCGNCLKQPPHFDTTHAPFIYQSTIRYLIHSLKFNAIYKNARLLGLLMAEHIGNTGPMPEVIVPVPLHPVRYRQRGFNQAIEIAKTVSKQLQIPIDFRSCKRQRNTPHQLGLPAKQRRKNMRNAFSVANTLDVRHVAILDDVMTTGTTVNELAGALKKTGVDCVDIWVCARA